jgi:hypothetical protein
MINSKIQKIINNKKTLTCAQDCIEKKLYGIRKGSKKYKEKKFLAIYQYVREYETLSETKLNNYWTFPAISPSTIDWLNNYCHSKLTTRYKRIVKKKSEKLGSQIHFNVPILYRKAISSRVLEFMNAEIFNNLDVCIDYAFQESNILPKNSRFQKLIDSYSMLIFDTNVDTNVNTNTNTSTNSEIQIMKLNSDEYDSEMVRYSEYEKCSETDSIINTIAHNNSTIIAEDSANTSSDNMELQNNTEYDSNGNMIIEGSIQKSLRLTRLKIKLEKIKIKKITKATELERIKRSNIEKKIKYVREKNKMRKNKYLNS